MMAHIPAAAILTALLTRGESATCSTENRSYPRRWPPVARQLSPDEHHGGRFAARHHRSPDARRGDPAADVCRSYLLMKLHAAEIATTYLDIYCRTAGMSRQAVLSWLP